MNIFFLYFQSTPFSIPHTSEENRKSNQYKAAYKWTTTGREKWRWRKYKLPFRCIYLTLKQQKWLSLEDELLYGECVSQKKEREKKRHNSQWMCYFHRDWKVSFFSNNFTLLLLSCFMFVCQTIGFYTSHNEQKFLFFSARWRRKFFILVVTWKCIKEESRFLFFFLLKLKLQLNEEKVFQSLLLAI